MPLKKSARLQGDAPIDIARNRYGVPIVQASTESDLYRGMGYCHGSDRALQLIMVKTLASGRACELLSDTDELIEVDRFFHKMNFGRGAEAELAKLSDHDRGLIDAYVDGVNRALDERFPWELKLLGMKSAVYEATDPVVLGRVVAFVNLAQSQGDMERLVVEMVQGGVSRGHLDELFPGLLADLDPYLLKKVNLGERLIPGAVRWNTSMPRAMASNNWVVGGTKTASGQPMLANDPHLEVNRLPAVWYELGLRNGDRSWIGATMPGLPAAIIGRTPKLAWGVTYAFMDAQDSWIEDCKDGTYRRVVNGAEKWLPFTVRTSTIKRRNGADETVTCYENDHGLLDGDPNEAGLYLASKWAPSEETGAASIAAFMGLLRADSVQEAIDLCRKIETAWSWVLADTDGNIGFQMSGKLPKRSDRREGFTPLPGWDPSNDWLGTVDPADLPTSYNPEPGFFVTANNDLNEHGNVRAITLPMGPYRAERIAEQLAQRDDWTVSGFERLQTDLHSRHAELFMDVLRPLLPATSHGELLRAWDLRYDRNSFGATLFERFYRTLLLDVFGRVCGPEVVDAMLNDTPVVADFFAQFDRVLLDEDSSFYGDEGREATWRRVAEACLPAAPVPWGEKQQITMSHILLGGKLPGFLGFDQGPFALEGCRGTIQQGQVYKNGGRVTSFAASYRFVTDLAQQGAHTCLAGGPSDRRMSKWYASDVDRWLNGRLKQQEA